MALRACRRSMACGRAGLLGGAARAQRIARRNEAQIRSCEALIANLTPFRGPSADAGTVFEVGFASALGLRMFGWSNDARPFAERTRAFLGAPRGSA